MPLCWWLYTFPTADKHRHNMAHQMERLLNLLDLYLHNHLVKSPSIFFKWPVEPVLPPLKEADWFGVQWNPKTD